MLERLLNKLIRFNTFIARFCSNLLMILLGIIVITMFGSVVWRYFLFNPITWSEDVSLLCMVWMTFLGAPVGMRNGHVATSGLVSALPPALSRWLVTIVNLNILFISAIVVYIGVPFVRQGMARIVPSLDWLAQGYIYLALPVGFALIASFCVENMLRPFLPEHSPLGDL